MAEDAKCTRSACTTNNYLIATFFMIAYNTRERELLFSLEVAAGGNDTASECPWVWPYRGDQGGQIAFPTRKRLHARFEARQCNGERPSS